MSNIKTAKVTISDTEDKLGLDELGVADLLAKANKAAAAADKLGTQIEGGFITSVMLLLRELGRAQETAGISGIQGALKDNPAFWAGGEYEEALKLIEYLSAMSKGTPAGTGSNKYDYAGQYPQLAKITLLHNGAAKIGDFIVEESGRIIMVDPSNGEIRLVFSIENLPAISDLVAGASSTGNIDVSTGLTSSSTMLNGAASITHSNGIAQISAVTVTLNASGRKMLNGMGSFATAELVLYRNGVRYIGLGSSTLFFTNDNYSLEYDSRTFHTRSINLGGAGIYTFGLEITTEGDVLAPNVSSTAFTFEWEATLQGVKRQQYGKDGLMFFYSDNHFHFTELGGLDVRGKHNVPGVLAKGRVASNGARDAAKYWGAKNNTALQVIKPSGIGSYRVPVDCPNGNYDVNISPRTANRMFHVGVTTSTYFEVFFRDHNGNPADSDFSYTVVGANY